MPILGWFGCILVNQNVENQNSGEVSANDVNLINYSLFICSIQIYFEIDFRTCLVFVARSSHHHQNNSANHFPNLPPCHWAEKRCHWSSGLDHQTSGRISLFLITAHFQANSILASDRTISKKVSKKDDFLEDENILNQALTANPCDGSTASGESLLLQALTL